jgi:hypothetical protein
VLTNDTDVDDNDIRVDTFDATSALGATVTVDTNWKSLAGGTFTYDPTAIDVTVTAAVEGDILSIGATNFEIDTAGDGVGTVGNVAVDVDLSDTPDIIATAIAVAINDPANAIIGKCHGSRVNSDNHWRRHSCCQ